QSACPGGGAAASGAAAASEPTAIVMNMAMTRFMTCSSSGFSSRPCPTVRRSSRPPRAGAVGPEVLRERGPRVHVEERLRAPFEQRPERVPDRSHPAPPLYLCRASRGGLNGG